MYVHTVYCYKSVHLATLYYLDHGCPHQQHAQVCNCFARRLIKPSCQTLTTRRRASRALREEPISDFLWDGICQYHMHMEAASSGGLAAHDGRLMRLAGWSSQRHEHWDARGIQHEVRGRDVARETATQITEAKNCMPIFCSAPSGAVH